MNTAPKIVILGADGFIGRHLAYHFRSKGWRVLAQARNPSKLIAMGFETLKCDLASAQALSADYWQPKLTNVDYVVNAAGILSGSAAKFQSIHVDAPRAILQAMPTSAVALLVSAVGIDAANTRFSRYRREAENLAKAEKAIVLRVGLVLGETSYGGSSLSRALAALPIRTPVVGTGLQEFNPIHAADLAEVIEGILQSGTPGETYETGGPDVITQQGLITALRSWMGLETQPVLKLPLFIARLLGRVGELFRLGPISATAVSQLEAGVLAQTTLPAAVNPPRGVSEFLIQRPPGTQDLWHARLYLMRPLLRLSLAVMWLLSGIMGMLLDPAIFLALADAWPLSDSLMTILARVGGMIDLFIAFALFRGWRGKYMTLLQLGLVALYTAFFTVTAPGLWLLPLGGLLKNIPLLVLLGIYAILEEER